MHQGAQKQASAEGGQMGLCVALEREPPLTLPPPLLRSTALRRTGNTHFPRLEGAPSPHSVSGSKGAWERGCAHHGLVR